MNLAVKFNLLKNTQPHYSYTPESCLESDSYKLYFDRTILTDIHIKHNRPDIIILNKQQKRNQAIQNQRNSFSRGFPLPFNVETLQAFGALFQIPQYYRKFLYYKTKMFM
jgi:hypothetical protein